MELITRNEKVIVALLSNISRSIQILDELKDSIKPALADEKYLTDKELSKVLKISRRTLQEYRNQGLIPYFHLGGKIIYKESDIEKILEKSYVKKWED